MKCFRYFISINGPSVHRGTGRGGGGGEGGCVYSGRRGAKLSQYCCQSVQYAAPVKAYTGWNELEVGRGVGRRYYEQSTLFNSCINFTNVHVCNYCTKIFVIIVNTCVCRRSVDNKALILILILINFNVFQGAIGAMVDQFIIQGDVLDGWLGKRRIKCHFLLSSDPQLLATKMIVYFAKGPLKLKYHKVQKTPESKRCSGILKGRK